MSERDDLLAEMSKSGTVSAAGKESLKFESREAPIDPNGRITSTQVRNESDP